jgi:hypothetical protein
MSNDTKQFVEQVAAEADATADQPMPAPATSTRPNESVTVATRMSPQDLHAIQALATELDVRSLGSGEVGCSPDSTPARPSP